MKMGLPERRRAFTAVANIFQNALAPVLHMLCATSMQLLMLSTISAGEPYKLVLDTHEWLPISFPGVSTELRN
jgi:hypothetical protein